MNRFFVVLRITSYNVCYTKLLRYVKGIVTADYQDVLEKEWIKELRVKYNVTVNQDVFNKIKADNK